MERQITQNNQLKMDGEEESQRIKLYNFKIYYTDTIIKTLWYCQDVQWKRIDHSETDPYKHSQLVFDKEEKAVHWRQDSLTTGHQ